MSPKLSAPLMLILLWLAAPVKTHAQSGSFEGSVFYNIRVSGKDAASFMANKPPNKMAMHIKDDNMLVNLSGGQRPRTFLYIGDSNHTYLVDAPNRRAFRKDYYKDTSNVVPTARKLDKTAVVKGYDCNVYGMKRPGQIIYFYVSDKFRVDTTLYAGEEKDEAKADFLIKGLGGRIPLKKVIKTRMLTTELEVTKINQTELHEENFLIPESFKLKGRDPR